MSKAVCVADLRSKFLASRVTPLFLLLYLKYFEVFGALCTWKIQYSNKLQSFRQELIDSFWRLLSEVLRVANFIWIFVKWREWKAVEIEGKRDRWKFDVELEAIKKAGPASTKERVKLLWFLLEITFSIFQTALFHMYWTSHYQALRCSILRDMIGVLSHTFSFAYEQNLACEW